jgi:hypothetical protein
MTEIHLAWCHKIRRDLVAVLARTVRSSKPNAAPMAWSGQPWQSKVNTNLTVSATLRCR